MTAFGLLLAAIAIIGGVNAVNFEVDIFSWDSECETQTKSCRHTKDDPEIWLDVLKDCIYSYRYGIGEKKTYKIYIRELDRDELPRLREIANLNASFVAPTADQRIIVEHWIDGNEYESRRFDVWDTNRTGDFVKSNCEFTVMPALLDTHANLLHYCGLSRTQFKAYKYDTSEPLDNKASYDKYVTISKDVSHQQAYIKVGETTHKIARTYNNRTIKQLIDEVLMTKDTYTCVWSLYKIPKRAAALPVELPPMADSREVFEANRDFTYELIKWNRENDGIKVVLTLYELNEHNVFVPYECHVAHSIANWTYDGVLLQCVSYIRQEYRIPLSETTTLKFYDTDVSQSINGGSRFQPSDFCWLNVFKKYDKKVVIGREKNGINDRLIQIEVVYKESQTMAKVVSSCRIFYSANTRTFERVAAACIKQIDDGLSTGRRRRAEIDYASPHSWSVYQNGRQFAAIKDSAHPILQAPVTLVHPDVLPQYKMEMSTALTRPGSAVPHPPPRPPTRSASKRIDKTGHH